MKQTTIQFDKRKSEPVTIQRLQQAIDSIANGTQLTEAIRSQGLGISFAKFLIAARILARIDHKTVVVLKPKLERKDFYRIMDIQTKDNLKRKKNRDAISFYEQKKDSPFIGRVPLPSEVNLPVEIQSIRVRGKARGKKAIALPWWKRILLYLANH
jgi:hypothetical protein